jgi:hypothetical protein
MALLARTTVAGEYSYLLSYSLDYSDNIGLATIDETSELTHVLDSGFTLSQVDRDLDARVAARATYRGYQKNTFSDETTLGLDGALVWKPLPDSFHWVVNDVYTQVVADPTQANTPTNRANTNVLSTGPDFFWRPNPVHIVQFGGRYVLNTFSGTDNASVSGNLDNKRSNGTLRWFYRYSPVTKLSLGHVTESVRFEDSGVGTNLDFRANETTVGIENRRSRNTFTLDLGETRINRSGQQEIQGKLGRLSWARDLTSGSAFSLTAERSLSDTTGELLAGSGGTPPVGAPLEINSSDIFTGKSVSLQYSQRVGGGDLGVSAFRRERVFELATSNNDDAKGGSVQYSRLFSGRVSGAASLSYVKTLFPMPLREDIDRVATASVQYRFSRTVLGSATVGRRTRDSTTALTEFEENRVILGLVYNSLPIRW